MTRFILLALLLLPSFAFADGHLGLVPAQVAVEVGQTFDVQVWVTQPGANFNSAGANVGYDPAVLEYVPMPRSFEEGPLMPSACGNTFFARRIYPLAGAAEYVHAVHVYSTTMCNLKSFTGPGHCFTLRFRALANGATSLRLIRRILSTPGFRYDDSCLILGGVRVTPLYLGADVAVQVGPAMAGGGRVVVQSAERAPAVANTWGRLKVLYR